MMKKNQLALIICALLASAIAAAADHRINIKNQSATESQRNSAKWMTEAAKAGLHEAQYNLGLMYLTGDGIDADKQQAAYWLKKAADAGNENAEAILEVLSKAQLVQKSKHTKHTGKAVEMRQALSKNDAVHVSPPISKLDSRQKIDDQFPYAIQIFAATDIEKSKKLVEQYTHTVTLKPYRKTVNQKDWYVLLHCCFDSHREANKVMSALPETLRIQKPFVINALALSPLR